MEAPQRDAEETIHRRGEEAARDAHEGAPRLQVQAQEETQDFHVRRYGTRCDGSARTGRLSGIPPPVFCRTADNVVSRRPQLLSDADVLRLCFRSGSPVEVGISE